MAIPVGKQLDADKCPPILRSIDELWGCRLTDIYDMRNEERSQPLADGSILEYIVHGEYASKETDTNSRYGAWWMSLRTMVRQVGKEVVEKKLDDFEDEVKRLRTQAIEDALEDSSSDDDEDR